MARPLIAIETGRVVLTVDQLQERPVGGWVHVPAFGRLEITQRPESLVVACPDVPHQSPGVGPLLFEQTDYLFFLRATHGARVELKTRDPILLQAVREQEGGRIRTGPINFGDQVGLCDFEVVVDGTREFAFQVEVFPSKLDYAHDYKDLLADVQQQLTGLALEYLRTAFRLGEAVWTDSPSTLEWAAILHEIVGELEQALNFVASAPVRRLHDEQGEVRVSRARSNSRVRSAIRHGTGRGPWVLLDERTRARTCVPSGARRETLDTPEHRWLAAQLRHVSRELALLREGTAEADNSRRTKVTEELTSLEERVQRLRRLEPIASAGAIVTTGFASLQLMRAPGYREAYQLLTMLNLGLRLEGAALRVPPKDISTLYEYWCYLTLVRLLRGEIDGRADIRELFSIGAVGLQVRLERGRTTTVRLQGADRAISVTYNPRFDGPQFLVAQQPDVVVGMSVPGWDEFLLIADAKYRVKADAGYVSRYRVPGPPEDSLNVLHRYRDALVERNARETPEVKRTVVEAVALYPFRDSDLVHYGDSLLDDMLQRIGVGALPLLPGSTEHVGRWLRSVVARTGWQVASSAVGDRATARLSDLRQAAIEVVLLVDRASFAQTAPGGVVAIPLVSDDLLAVRSISVVSNGTTTELCAVVNTRLVASDETSTQVQYSLAAPGHRRNELDVSELFVGAVPRWFTTSRLAWERARTAPELLITAEHEWRLYDELVRLGLAVTVRGSDDGTHWLVLPDASRVRSVSGSSIILRRADGSDWTLRRIEDVLDQLAPL